MDFLQRLNASFISYKSEIAFCIEDKFYTYQDLHNRVVAIQDLLNTNLPANSTRVGVITNNDLDTYAALIACWFSGASYVPLNPFLPTDRNDVIVKEAGIRLILNSGSVSTGIGIQDEQVKTCFSGRAETIQGELLLNSSYTSQEMYVLFTSGSTGVPKGVPISFTNLNAFVTAFESTPVKIALGDRCLQMFELTFDVSVSSFLIPLLNGASVYTTASDSIKYIQVLKLISKYELTTLQIVPSIIRLGSSLLQRLNFPFVKHCILTGEATSVDLLPAWKLCLPAANIYNFYGPTEATIYCSYLKLDMDNLESYNSLLAIGEPFSGMHFQLLNKEGEEVGPGEKAELLIGGMQISNGYVNSPENRHAFFSTDNNGQQERFYRSGDLCFKNERGCYFYCGRLDNQVKIQGFRVELNEIEFTVREKYGLNNIVFISENEQKLTELILIIESMTADNLNVIDYLKTKLPAYMVPSKVYFLKEFPLSTSGKTDRKKIRQLVNDPE